MARYRTKGTELFDANGTQLATVRAAGIYDADNRKVAIVTSSEVYDLQNNRVAVLRGLDICDSRNHKIATLSDIYKEIDSLLCGPALVGLWYFFVRKKSSRSPRVPVAKGPSTNVWNRIQRFLGFGIQDDRTARSDSERITAGTRTKPPTS
jgi:hypothetical protein